MSRVGLAVLTILIAWRTGVRLRRRGQLRRVGSTVVGHCPFVRYWDAIARRFGSRELIGTAPTSCVLTVDSNIRANSQKPQEAESGAVYCAI